MLNCVNLIGRLVNDPVIVMIDETTKVCNITLAVTRPFKNSNGEYSTDFIPISFWYGAANLAEEYCFKGDLIFVKGRIYNKTQEIEGKKYSFLEMVGERIIFLNSKERSEPIEELKE